RSRCAVNCDAVLAPRWPAIEVREKHFGDSNYACAGGVNGCGSSVTVGWSLLVPDDWPRGVALGYGEEGSRPRVEVKWRRCFSRYFPATLHGLANRFQTYRPALA